jgi:hypothetical protein
MPIPNAGAASFTAQAEPDSLDLDIIQAGLNGTGVTSGCACTPNASGSTLVVAVASGGVIVNGTVVAVGSGTVTPGAAHASLPRFDLVVVNSSGTKSIIAGTAATAPVFPAAPASTYAVLASVYIPATATSITAGNIVDKRQMLLVNAAATTPSLRKLGTASTDGAAGDHTHAGAYASTAHAATHAEAGSDPLIDFTNINMATAIDFNAILAGGPPAAPIGDSHIKVYAHWLGYRPVPSVRSVDRWMPFGDEITGPSMVWRVHPGTGTTAPIGSLEVPSTMTAASWATPSATTALGYRQTMVTSTTSGNGAFLSTTDNRYVRGDNVLPWCGYYFHARVVTDHANGYTTSRIFVGLTDQTPATALGATDPAGHRHGFKCINGTGNWLMTVKNGTTEATLDSGIAFATNSVFDFYIYVRPAGGYPFGHVINQTAGTDSGALIDVSGSGSIPGATTFMKAMAGVATVTTAARGLSFHRVGCEVAV